MHDTSQPKLRDGDLPLTQLDRVPDPESSASTMHVIVTCIHRSSVYWDLLEVGPYGVG